MSPQLTVAEARRAQPAPVTRPGYPQDNSFNHHPQGTAAAGFLCLKLFKVFSPLLGAAARQAARWGCKGGSGSPQPSPPRSSLRLPGTGGLVAPFAQLSASVLFSPARGTGRDPRGPDGAQPVTFPGGRVALHPSGCPSTRTTRVLSPRAPWLAPISCPCKLYPGWEQLQ